MADSDGTDPWAATPRDSDPLLIRPYINRDAEDGEADEAGSATTWPTMTEPGARRPQTTAPSEYQLPESGASGPVAYPGTGPAEFEPVAGSGAEPAGDRTADLVTARTAGAAAGYAGPAPDGSVSVPDGSPPAAAATEAFARAEVASDFPERLHDPDPTRPDPGRRLLWVFGVAAAAVVLVAIGLAALGPKQESSTPFAGPQGIPAPITESAAPAAPSATPSLTGRAGSASAVLSPSATGAQAGPNPTTAPGGTQNPVAPPPPPAGAEPSPTLSPPPTQARIGAITGGAGRCLDVSTGIALLGGPVTADDCNGTLSQRWTLATDGTLQVGGGCAQANDDGSARLAGCNSTQAAQWRAGPASSLVNLASGGCLTNTTGSQIQLAACRAGSDQQWTLP